MDLVLPVTCGGCGRPGSAWCGECARALADVPREVRPRLDPGVPVYATGPYRGAHRAAVLAVKEHGRRDLVVPLGDCLAVAVVRLRRWSVVPAGPLALVPSPTRARAARSRGGDVVTALARRAIRYDPRWTVDPVLRSSGRVRDSAGLGAVARARNIAGRVECVGPVPASPVVVVDDVVTTGATIRESVRVLTAHGVRVHAAVCLASA